MKGTVWSFSSQAWLRAKVSDSTAACMVLAIIIGCHCSSDQEEKSNIYCWGLKEKEACFLRVGPVLHSYTDWSERCQHLLLLFVSRCKQCSNEVQNWQHMVDFGVFVFLALLVSEIPTAEWSQWFSLSEKWFTLYKNKAWCKQSCIHWNEGCSPQTSERTFLPQFFREVVQLFLLVWISGQLSRAAFSAITPFMPWPGTEVELCEIWAQIPFEIPNTNTNCSGLQPDVGLLSKEGCNS